MSKIVKTTLDKQADVKSIRPIQLLRRRRTFVTLFNEELRIPEIALLSETALLADDRPFSEEDTTRPHLQSE